jgi:NADPH:quinone reductase-like Zn-dependent oxidoreductase
MKAAQIKNYGSPQDIQINDVDEPVVAHGHVLVEVYASCINPFDYTILTGALREMIPLPMPLTLGLDIAGIVREVGADVSHVKPGDKIFGSAGVVGGGSGALAEVAVAKQEQIASMPQTTDFVEAASLVLTGQSAIQAIDSMALQTGQRLLIHGGSGGIGSAAIQYAKHLGLFVATTATGEGVAFAKSLGADEVIDYKKERFEDTLKDYDAVFDTVAGETYTRSFSVLKQGGVIVSMNEQPNQELAKAHGVTALFQSTKTTVESLAKLATLIDESVIKPAVGAVFALADTTEAFTTWRGHGIKGKVAVQIKER